MPRQIIDTESSRPAYVRRQITTFVVVAILVVALAVAVWFAVRPHSATQAAPTRAVPGNSAH